MPDGRKMDRVMKERGITQYRLSKITGIPQSSLSKMRRHDRSTGERSLAKICKALGCKPEEIMLEVENGE